MDSRATTTVICSLALALLLSLIPATLQYHRCSEAFSDVVRRRNITHCKKLPSLDAEFGWYLHPSENHSCRIDFVVGKKLRSNAGWLAWGVNPLGPQMVGTRAIIGIWQADGSVYVDTYSVTRDTKAGCRLEPSRIDLEMQNMTGDYVVKEEEEEEEDYFVLSATIVVDPTYDVSRLNHVWQVGYAVDNGIHPRMHPGSLRNFESAESIDLATGEGAPVGDHKWRLRTVHGIVNIIGWGTLLPIGAIIARYFRMYPFRCKVWWYNIHVSCQVLGYVLGTGGWAMGLLLGNTSRNYKFDTHRNLAILIFTFATLQMLALRLRPKTDDPYRKYWNIYHHFLGYGLLILIAVNIFKGVRILHPETAIWKQSYSAIVGLLTAVAAAFEIYTWTKFLRERLRKNRPRQLARGSEGQGQPSHPQIVGSS